MTQQDLEELFTRYTARIPGTDTIRAIDLNTFTAAAEYIAHKAYVQGVDESLNHMQQAIDMGVNAVGV